MWTYLIIMLVLGIVLGFAATRIILSKQFKHVRQIDQEAVETNRRLRENIIRAQSELQHTEKEDLRLQHKQAVLQNTLSDLTSKIKKSQEEADQAVDIYYSKAIAAAKQNIQLDIEQLEADYTKAEREYQKEYQATMEEAVVDFKKQSENLKSTIKTLSLTLKDLREKVAAAVDANKRAIELECQTDFYRLILSDIDIQEIKKLREVAQYLRDSEPLNKVIWKVYYERPYTDLIGRVVGSGVHCGIYKITNIDNGMCYVGQAVNIADRWKQHIKRGIGADPPTRNKLYPAMLASGVENFTFEIIEECGRDKLNEREIYWQEFFKAKEYGYSIK